MKAILKLSRTSEDSSVIPINDSFNLVAMESTACFKGGLLICTFGPFIALTNKYSEPFSKKKKLITKILVILYKWNINYLVIHKLIINIENTILYKITHQFLKIYCNQKHVSQIISFHKTLIVC